jgi:superfamily II DNA/RNA helicase
MVTTAAAGDDDDADAGAGADGYGSAGRKRENQENQKNLVGMGLSEEEIAVLLASEDENVLTTALSRSIAVEDYSLAAQLSARLKAVQGVGDEPGAEILDWRALGMAEWLCSRAEDLGFRYPTAVQRRASLAFFKDKDVVIQAQTGSGKTLAYLMPTIDNMEFTARRMLQILVIVPSRELTIQTVMLTFRLFGGNVNVGVPGDPGNMFNYSGPQGIKCVGVFDEEHETREGFAEIAEIVVGTPEALARMKNSGRLEVDLATTIIADEADQLFEQHPEAMAELLKPSPYAPVMEDRQIVLCGVSVPKDVVATCEQRGHIKSPMMVSMGNPGRVPPSVVHRRLVVPRMRKILALARQIRSDLKAAGEDAPPPRTIVFVPSAAAAEAAAIPLRKSLWNQHKLAVLLPDGKEAVRTMLDFKNQKSTLLLCTPETVGLYTLNPVDP